jgi:hypothetical protein
MEWLTVFNTLQKEIHQPLLPEFYDFPSRFQSINVSVYKISQIFIGEKAAPNRDAAILPQQKIQDHVLRAGF